MLQYAELTGLLRTLVIILAVYWGFRLFSRYALPWLLKRLMVFVGKKAQENMRSRGFDMGGFQNPYEETVASDEKVTVNKTTSQKKSNNNLDDVGEYVDFEEVE